MVTRPFSSWEGGVWARDYCVNTWPFALPLRCQISPLTTCFCPLFLTNCGHANHVHVSWMLLLSIRKLAEVQPGASYGCFMALVVGWMRSCIFPYKPWNPTCLSHSHSGQHGHEYCHFPFWYTYSRMVVWNQLLWSNFIVGCSQELETL